MALPVEKLDSLAGVIEHMLSREALCLRDVSDLVILAAARIQRPPEEELGHNTPQGPHVYGLTEW